MDILVQSPKVFSKKRFFKKYHKIRRKDLYQILILNKFQVLGLKLYLNWDHDADV